MKSKTLQDKVKSNDITGSDDGNNYYRELDNPVYSANEIPKQTYKKFYNPIYDPHEPADQLHDDSLALNPTCVQ